MQVDYAVGKAKRATSKVCTLIDRNHGIPVQIGVDLYKSLVRPHLEYALPVWANISERDINKMESTQHQCLKRVIGAKLHSSSSAVEVICGIMPIRFRKRELCNREYVRIIIKDNDCELRKLLESSSRIGLRFCPMDYIRVMSRELARAICGYNLVKPEEVTPTTRSTAIMNSVSVSNILEVSSGTNALYRHDDGSNMQSAVMNDIMNQCKGFNVMIFSDGSVYGGSVGYGSCAAVLYPLNVEEEIILQTKAVGSKVNSHQCEVEGVILGMKMAIHYFHNFSRRKLVEDVYIFCDSSSAIDSIDEMRFKTRPDIFIRLQELRQELHHFSINIKLVKIIAHSGIPGHDLVDQHAKEVAYKIAKGEITAPSVISVDDTLGISAAIARRSWQRYWDNDNTGRYTYDLIPIVQTKVKFPRRRHIGVAYCRMLLHDTMLNYDSYRTGTSATPICDCGKSNETTEHFLLHCSNYAEARCDMMNYIKDTSVISKNKGSFSISENILLAPPCGNNVSNRDNIIIKEALFEFLHKADRTI